MSGITVVVAPALTAEQWAVALRELARVPHPEEFVAELLPIERALRVVAPSRLPNRERRQRAAIVRIALENAGLPDDSPYKFTWADFDMWNGRNPEAQIVADKIRAILPPRGP